MSHSSVFSEYCSLWWGAITEEGEGKRVVNIVTMSGIPSNIGMFDISSIAYLVDPNWNYFLIPSILLSLVRFPPFQ